MDALKGTGVALVTPFKQNAEIDFDGLEKLVEHVIKGGVEYLVVLGTTGESVTLSPSEKADVLNCVKQVNQGRLPIVLGMGGNNTAALIQQAREVNLEGVSGLLSASPSYNKPTQEGIYQHFKAFAESTDKPIILYNVPGRTASNIQAATTLRLARDFENIIGIKEASADLDQVMAIIQDKPKDFLVISGEDGLTLPIVASGGDGVISVVANAYPKHFSEMVRLTAKADLEKARALHYKLKKFIDLLFKEGNPGGVKAALKHLGVCEAHLRLPLWPISTTLNNSIASQIKEIQQA
ncbi:MAG: 4-hydroxy-tetrahydrodipicolinate synthase [Vicingaceae bacterium]